VQRLDQTLANAVSALGFAINGESDRAIYPMDVVDKLKQLLELAPATIQHLCDVQAPASLDIIGHPDFKTITGATGVKVLSFIGTLNAMMRRTGLEIGVARDAENAVVDFIVKPVAKIILHV
jgi:hypothetical protein